MGIDISRFKGLLRQAAEKADSEGNKNKELDFSELSLFFKGLSETSKKEPKSNAGKKASIFNAAPPEQETYIAKRDATYVAPRNSIELPLAKPMVKAEAAAQPEPVKKSYKDHPKYDQVSALVEFQLVKRIPLGKGKFAKSIDDINIPAKQEEFRNKVDYITKIVLEKCEKYDIQELAPVVAEMLGVETGGYNFSPKVLKNPGRSYKGVMQVDMNTCKSIYAEGGVKYKDWHNKHFKQDDERINELRKKYPTAHALYEAIQEDVELGLEVGIIALKAKIHESKGSVARGIAKYCGNQYKCNIPGVPGTVDFNEYTA